MTERALWEVDAAQARRPISPAPPVGVPLPGGYPGSARERRKPLNRLCVGCLGHALRRGVAWQARKQPLDAVHSVRYVQRLMAESQCSEI